jgi:single-strand DNA-binding protein
MNSITVAGNLAKDPELAYSANGEPICKFSIGSKDKSTSDDVTWHNIVCFRGLAENVAGSLSKGNRIMVVGRLSKRNYEKKDGTQGQSVEIIANDIAASMLFSTVEITKVNFNGKKESNVQQTEEEPF